MGTNLAYAMALMWLYVAWRVIWPLPWAAGWRVGLMVVVLLAAQYHWIAVRFFGSLASPEMPRVAMVLVGWAFGAVLLLAILALLRDLAGVLLWLVWRAGGRAVLGGQALNLLVAGGALALAALGTWQGVRVPPVKAVSIAVPGLPAAFDGYRVVQLSDIHASRLLPRSWQDAVVARTNALRPDLIVITGDLADGTPAQRAADVAPLATLQAHDGVLAIPGNHEYYADYVNWMRAYRVLGLTMLENQHVLIERGGAELAVAGLTDRQARAFGQPQPDLSAALRGVPAGTPTIVLQHRPGAAAQNAQAGVALQLSGHTHGGQVLGLNLITRAANRGFVSGLFSVDGMPLYVSNGTGLWNGFVLRLGVPSEITEITLHPQATAGVTG